MVEINEIIVSQEEIQLFALTESLLYELENLHHFPGRGGLRNRLERSDAGFPPAQTRGEALDNYIANKNVIGNKYNYKLNEILGQQPVNKRVDLANKVIDKLQRYITMKERGEIFAERISNKHIDQSQDLAIRLKSKEIENQRKIKRGLGDRLKQKGDPKLEFVTTKKDITEKQHNIETDKSRIEPNPNSQIVEKFKENKEPVIEYRSIEECISKLIDMDFTNEKRPDRFIERL